MGSPILVLGGGRGDRAESGLVALLRLRRLLLRRVVMTHVDGCQLLRVGHRSGVVHRMGHAEGV